jgi:hypothetical protein
MADLHHADRQQDNPDVQPESGDVSVRGVLAFAIGLAALALVVHIALAVLFNYFAAREARAKESAFPLALEKRQQGATLPPEPRLEALNSGLGVAQYASSGSARTGLTEEQQKQVEWAMDQLKLPVRAEPADNTGQDPALRQPSDSSSGRTDTGGRQ